LKTLFFATKENYVTQANSIEWVRYFVGWIYMAHSLLTGLLTNLCYRCSPCT